MGIETEIDHKKVLQVQALLCLLQKQVDSLVKKNYQLWARIDERDNEIQELKTIIAKQCLQLQALQVLVDIKNSEV